MLQPSRDLFGCVAALLACRSLAGACSAAIVVANEREWPRLVGRFPARSCGAPASITASEEMPSNRASLHRDDGRRLELYTLPLPSLLGLDRRC